jgi:hypothetical protein
MCSGGLVKTSIAYSLLAQAPFHGARKSLAGLVELCGYALQDCLNIAKPSLDTGFHGDEAINYRDEPNADGNFSLNGYRTVADAALAANTIAVAIADARAFADAIALAGSAESETDVDVRRP